MAITLALYLVLAVVPIAMPESTNVEVLLGVVDPLTLYDSTRLSFSLFREYMAQLVEYGKSFLIIGNQNAITYQEILPLVRDNKEGLGYNSGHFWFVVPDTCEEKATDFMIDENGQKWRRDAIEVS